MRSVVAAARSAAARLALAARRTRAAACSPARVPLPCSRRRRPRTVGSAAGARRAAALPRRHPAEFVTQWPIGFFGSDLRALD